MTDNNYTALCLIMDRSGSMESLRKEAQAAINTFIVEQKELPGKATFTFAQFDDHYDLIYDNVPFSDVSEIALVPRGMTALNDAVARTVVHLGERLAALPEDERPGKVLVAIVTDGLENSSQEWRSKEKLKALLIEQQEKYKWEIIYLGANVDAFAEGEAMGLTANSSRGWQATPAGAGAMAQSLSTYTTSYRSTGKGTWGDEDNPPDPREGGPDPHDMH